ncbi:MAG: tetratricopeptide repeat protein [Nitrospira sp.]|nr:tetratricopeptide repeat protein [Nitrospira sp.]
MKTIIYITIILAFTAFVVDYILDRVLVTSHPNSALQANPSAGIASPERNSMDIDNDSIAPEALYHKASSHFSAGQVREGLELLSKAAGLGYPKAMSDLGALYSKGIGVPEDWEEAIKWWTRAAQIGDLGAIYNVGAYYYRRGDFSMAFSWFSEAANRGLPEGMMSVGYMYVRGESVSQNRAEGLRWLRAAAKAGLPAAKNILNAYEGDGQRLEESDMAYVIDVDTWSKVLTYALDGDTSAVFDLFASVAVDKACLDVTTTMNSPSLAAQQTGSLLHCSAGAVIEKAMEADIDRIRAAIAGLLLQRYGLELWKPTLGTNEAVKKTTILSSNYDRMATINAALSGDSTKTIFVVSYENLLKAAQANNAPTPDYVTKRFAQK